MANKKLVLFGECMIELAQNNSSLKQGFAGDVFNAAVYLKRWFNDIDVKLFTALGTDEFSQAMKGNFNSEGLQNDLVLSSPDKIPGLYAIKTDEQGERSFTYWRSDSAARYIMELVQPDHVEELKKADMFFFSGISLAVLTPETREAFWQLVWQLKNSGVKIVFDPNYRARLWSSLEETKLQYELALQASNVVMPGIEDFEQIYGHRSFAEVKTFCLPFQIDELVIKDGPNGVFVESGQEKYLIEIDKVNHVVDTTSAGDSFNGAYLGARLSGMGIKQAVQLAAKTAGFVIQHPGAIVEKNTFQQFVLNNNVEVRL